MEKTGLKPNMDAEALLEVAKLEDLAEKKTKIYSRLLTEPTLAKEMERLAACHAKRKNALLVLAGLKEPKNKKDGGMDEMSTEEDTE